MGQNQQEKKKTIKKRRDNSIQHYNSGAHTRNMVLRAFRVFKLEMKFLRRRVEWFMREFPEGNYEERFVEGKKKALTAARKCAEAHQVLGIFNTQAHERGITQ